MLGALDAVFRTALAALRAALPKVFVSDHPPAVYRPIVSAAGEHPGVFKLGDELDALALSQPSVPADLRRGHGSSVDCQVPVGFALMGDAEHVHPQAPGGNAAGLQSHVLEPVCRVKLEGWALHVSVAPRVTPSAIGGAVVGDEAP